MKKFLSLVLTLALTLSLVVLPARADVSSVTLNKASVTLDKDGTETLTATVTKTAEEATTVTWSSSDESIATVADGVVTAVAKGTATITATSTADPSKTATCTVNVTDLVADFGAEDCNDFKFCGRTYTAANVATVMYYEGDEFSANAFTTTLKDTTNYKNLNCTYEGNATSGTIKLTAKTKDNKDCSKNIAVTPSKVTPGDVTITPNYGTGLASTRVGQETVLTASYTALAGGTLSYSWKVDGTTDANATAATYNCKALEAGEHKFIVTVKEGNSTAEVSDEYFLTVSADTNAFTAKTYDNKMATGTKQFLSLYLNDGTYVANDVKISWSVRSGDASKISVAQTGEVTAGSTSGTAVVYATPEYRNKTYPQVAFTITVAALDKTLTDIENGDYDSYSLSTLEEYAASVINDVYSSKNLDDDDIQHIYIGSSLPSSLKLVLYDDSDFESSDKYATGAEITDELYVKAVAGFLGTESFKLKVKTNELANNEYIITFFVESTADETIDATASGEEYSNTQISFELPDDYDYWFVYTGSSSFKDTMYDGLWKKTGTAPTNWTRYAAGDTCKINAKYEDGDVTLYVVGLDEDGDEYIASTGKLTVAVDGYDVEYSGAAGETITFDQDDFDDLLDEVADDRNQDGSKAKVEFKKVTFSIPTEKTEGILYNNGTKITKSSTACTDLDKVTFAIADKAKKDVVIKFTMTYDYYKDSTASKPTRKDETVSGRVVVSVVSEDIKYSVPVDGTVTFKPYDFEDFYTDTYKNGKLSYVKFTELPKVADGALYATYSTLYAGTLAKTSDKFYYDSSKITDLDLDDVTFRTSLWTKTGTKVYLPFEAYGTTSKNSSSVSSTPVKGCVVITVTAAKTMSFTDVKSGDWFYDNVKNAYTMGLIEGKTATTFNPNDNMTYAEAVTLAARMNELYNTGKVTLENSKTGNWYSSYESYAISKGIISSYLGAKANTKITRRDYVEIFYNALPVSAYTVKNTITKIPDLANDSTNAKIYTFYKAGILTGYANTPGKTTGSFGPNDNIKRSEVATILIRMMDASTRMYFTL